MKYHQIKERALFLNLPMYKFYEINDSIQDVTDRPSPSLFYKYKRVALSNHISRKVHKEFITNKYCYSDNSCINCTLQFMCSNEQVTKKIKIG